MKKSGPTVAVLTVSKRDKWGAIALKSIHRQTRRPDQWVVVVEHELTADVLRRDATIIKAPPKTRFSNLNASLNAGLRKIDADYVVFYQDFIELEPDTIEKLLKWAVGLGAFITTATINDDGSMDGRYTKMDDLRPCDPAEWEANVAIAPMKALRELGGFDETYDDGWSWDNVNVAERAKMLGYRFYIDESIKPQLLYHPKETTAMVNRDFHARKMQMIADGEIPLTLNYLSSKWYT